MLYAAPFCTCAPPHRTPADLARGYTAAGASAAQLRGCLRHLVVFAGYGPCLAATLTLHKAKLLPEDTPAKVWHGEAARGRWGCGRWGV